MTDMDDEQGAAVSIPIEVDERVPDDTEQPVKAEKPRGKCTGCAFEYQLTTIRSGELKGTQVIRKHNSRTGPGLCSGAYDVPEPTYEELEGAARTTAVARLSGDVVGVRRDAPEARYGLVGDVVGVAPGGTPRVADPWTAPTSVAAVAEALGVQDYASPVAAAIQRGEDPFTTEQKETMAVVAGVFGNTMPLPFTAPAPASDIPESTTTVSGQPDPDRDQYGRYMIMGSAHTRATTFAKLGANTKAIEAWNERNVIRGMTLRPDLLMLANGLEVKRDREQLNGIAAQAKDAAGSKVAANIGTAYHAFSERIDAHLMTLPEVPQQYQGRVFQYIDALARAGLTTRPEWIERTTAVRADQVGAPLPVAGTLDRIFQLPDGSLVIGDLKTGSDLSYGEMEIEVQLALYAHGVNTHGLFDWNTKTWQTAADKARPGEMLQGFVRTDIAIVVHLPADGDGCTLYVADIARGWRDAQRLGPLQASLKEKSRFRTLTAADLAPRPEPYPQSSVGSPPSPVGRPAMTMREIRRELGHHVEPAPEPPVAALQYAVDSPVIEPPDSKWEYAKDAFRTARDKDHLAKLYEVAVGLGFHTDQLAVLVGLGKDRLNDLARA